MCACVHALRKPDDDDKQKPNGTTGTSWREESKQTGHTVQRRPAPNRSPLFNTKEHRGGTLDGPTRQHRGLYPVLDPPTSSRVRLLCHTSFSFLTLPSSSDLDGEFEAYQRLWLCFWFLGVSIVCLSFYIHIFQHVKYAPGSYLRFPFSCFLAFFFGFIASSRRTASGASCN